MQSTESAQTFAQRYISRKNCSCTLRTGQGSVFPMAMQAACPAIATRHGSRLRCIEPTVTG